MLYLAIFAAFCFPFSGGDDTRPVHERLSDDGIASIFQVYSGLTAFRISDHCEQSVAAGLRQDLFRLHVGQCFEETDLEPQVSKAMHIVRNVKNLYWVEVFGYQPDSPVINVSVAGIYELRDLRELSVFADGKILSVPAVTDGKTLDRLESVRVEFDCFSRPPASDKASPVKSVEEQAEAAKNEHERVSSLISLLKWASASPKLRNIQVSWPRVLRSELVEVIQSVPQLESLTVSLPRDQAEQAAQAEFDQLIQEVVSKKLAKVVNVGGPGVHLTEGSAQLIASSEHISCFATTAELDDASLVALTRSESIREIGGCFAGVTDVGMRSLTQMPKLRAIAFSSGQPGPVLFFIQFRGGAPRVDLSKAAVEVIGNLTAVECVDLCNCTFDAETLLKAVGRSKTIRCIVYRDNACDDPKGLAKALKAKGVNVRVFSTRIL